MAAIIKPVNGGGGLELVANAGIHCRMSEMRKITAFLPASLIDTAMASSGLGLTETLRVALREHNHRAASQRLLDMRGKIPFELDWRDLRGKDEE